jgi:hypothetical protein
MLRVLWHAAAELAAAPNLELLLKEATDAYRAGDYNRALALCQPVRDLAAAAAAALAGCSSCSSTECYVVRAAMCTAAAAACVDGHSSGAAHARVRVLREAWGCVEQ